MQAPQQQQQQPRPQGKVRQLGPARFQPVLVHKQAQAPLGDAHASAEAAEAAYDVGKLLLMRQLHPGRPLEQLKLHRPAAAYTTHPLWARLTAPHCSFEEACSLLADGLAADFLLPAAAVQLRAQQQQPQRRQKAARRDSGSAELREAASGSVVEEGSDGEEEEEEESGRYAGQKRRRQHSSQSSDRQHAAAQGAERESKWGGLGPDGVAGAQGITMPLSKSQTGLKSSATSIPERYARALASVGRTGQLPPTIELTAPDGSTHSCKLYQAGTRKSWYIGRMKQLLDSLRPVAAGDLLRFTPAGRGAASVALVRGRPQAAGEGRSRVPVRALGDARIKWSGLEPTDSRRYARALAASAVRNDSLTMPARYAVAAFGQAPERGAAPLEATATSAADGSTHALRMFARRSGIGLSRLGSLLASLGAAAGDTLCLEPAGLLAVRASLVKASAAAAAGADAAEEEEEAEEEAEEAEQQQQQQEQQQQPDSHSVPAATAAGGSSGADASLPGLVPAQHNPAALWHSPAALWGAADQLLAALETQGGVGPSQAAAYHRAFAALPSHSWRLAHVTLLRSFVYSGDWAAAAAWMAEC